MPRWPRTGWPPGHDHLLERPSPRRWWLAGLGHGRVGTRARNMIVQANGSYKASTTRGSMSEGQFYLQDGKLRYRSSRTTGTVSLSEDKGTTTLTVTPEDPCVDCSQHL